MQLLVTITHFTFVSGVFGFIFDSAFMIPFTPEGTYCIVRLSFYTHESFGKHLTLFYQIDTAEGVSAVGLYIFENVVSSKNAL